MFGDYNQRYVFGDPHGNPEGYDMSGDPGHWMMQLLITMGHGLEKKTHSWDHLEKNTPWIS